MIASFGMDLNDFEALFEGFARSAFRVEALDRYEVVQETEELEAFLRGETLARRTPDSDPWLAMVAAATAQGRSVERVRIFARPLTDYTRFEFAAYSDNVAAGEKVRVIERSWLRMEDRGWANEDFWIFDDEIVVLLRYDQRGRFLGVDRADEIQQYLSAKDRAISIAVDFDDAAKD